MAALYSRLGMTLVLLFIGIVPSAGTHEHSGGSALLLIAFASIVVNSIWFIQRRQQR